MNECSAREALDKARSLVLLLATLAAMSECSAKEALDKARSLVLLLATLAATVTYTAGLDPPGGLWQDNGDGHMAGDPILLTTNAGRYKAFFYCNSAALVTSLVAIILVQNKLLVKHHVLEVAMILVLFGLIGAYAAGSCRDVNTSIYTMALAGVVLVYVVIHVVVFTLDHKDKKGDEKLLEKRRKRLLLFAILAATITYQAGLTPPGGFLLRGDELGHHAGDPVLLYNFPRRYNAFFYCNTVSFMLSIALIILLVNPNLYRPAIRSNALSVCAAVGLFCLMAGYAAGSTQHIRTSIYIFVLVAVVAGVAAILLIVFLVRELERNGNSAAPAPSKSIEQKGKQEEKKKHVRRKYLLMLLGILVASLKPPGGAWQSSGNGYEAGNSAAAAPSISIEQDDKEEEREEEEGEEKKKRAGRKYLMLLGILVASVKEEKQEKKKHTRRKYLMLLGILVASVTYQAGLKPPGGAWQSSGNGYEAGNPVMHDTRRPQYLTFFYSNSISFVASILVIIMLLRHWLAKEEKEWEEWSLTVMKGTIVVNFLTLLVAYAAGSSRGWKTSVYVGAFNVVLQSYLAIPMALSLCFACCRRLRESSQENP